MSILETLVPHCNSLQKTRIACAVSIRPSWAIVNSWMEDEGSIFQQQNIEGKVRWYLSSFFLNCFSTFNNYSMPILQTAHFTNYLNSLKHIFPTQWAFLSLHCNINLNCDWEQLMDFKESQVFIALLILHWMSNIQSLPHWCLIMLMAMYGWGTRETLGHATSFLGINESYRCCDKFTHLLHWVLWIRLSVYSPERYLDWWL